jgi:hypothetical protein
MNLFDKVLDAYYDIRFKIEDTIDSIKFRVSDIVDGVKGCKDENSDANDTFDIEEPVKPKKKKKAKAKKKKK